MVRIILAVILVAAQLTCLAACGVGDVPANDGTTVADPETTAPESTGPVDVLVPLAENGKAIYTIVRAEQASKMVVSAAVELRQDLSSVCGAELTISDDWLRPGTTADSAAFEILVGMTNREQSVSLGSGLGADDYVIAKEGNKIVICGGSAFSTVMAVEYFKQNCIVDGKVKLSEMIEYKNDYVAKNMNICGIPIEEYTIVYSSSAPRMDGKDVAEALVEAVSKYTGAVLKIAPDSHTGSDHEIVIGNARRTYSRQLYEEKFDTYDYKICCYEGDVYLVGGSCFALQYCIKYLSSAYMAHGTAVDEGMTATGSMYGNSIYGLEQGAELRIMSNNVWDCNANQQAWKDIGEDCSAKTRSVGLAATYMAYTPDVICFQEMSIAMIGYIQKELSSCGFSYKLLSYTSGNDPDNTCILYRADTVKLLDSGYHEYTYGCNSGSKSYTWGYFEQLSTGKRFCALSTHLWYKSESAQPGSDKMRADQCAEVVAAMDKVIQKYDCPVFVMGDLNTRTTTAAFKVLLDGGYKNTFSLASVFADDHKGRHSCSPSGFALEESDGRYATDAIDHILLKNGGDTKVFVFDHARPYFYIKLSDHYPVFVDVTLG